MASKIKVDTLETADGTGSITLNNPIAGVSLTEDTSGNVGIGTNTPSYKMTVSDSTTNGKHIRLENGTELGFLTVNTSGDLRLWAHGSSTKIVTGTGTGTTTATFDGAGNMGLGVTPESWASNHIALQLGTGANIHGRTDRDAVLIGANNYNDGQWKRIGANGAGYTSLYQQHLGAHTFFTGASGTADSAISWTTAMTIDNSGNVLVGKSSSGSSGDGITLRNDSNNGGRITFTRVNETDTQFHMSFYTYSGTKVGEVTTSTTSTAYVTASDYRLKENVVPMSGSIDRLKTLKPSRFNFIADTDKTVDGFLAHEAQAIVPECVTGEKDAMRMEEYEVTPAVMDGETVVTEAVMGEREVPDYQGIDQAKLVPLLTSALQDAIAKIEQLESRISALEVN